MNNPFLEALTRVIRTGSLAWDVKPYTPGGLPPGAWLKRLSPTGTLLDHPAHGPEYVHPLEAVATYAGRFEKAEERKSIALMVKARYRFRDACDLWGQGCGFKTPGVAARWFFLFTPVGPRPAQANLDEYVSGIMQGSSLWSRLSIPGDFAAALIATEGATSGPAYRPNFWSTEIHWK